MSAMGNEQKPQPKLRPCCGLGAASWQPSAAGTRGGGQDHVYKKPRAEALFTSLREGAEEPPHGAFHCERSRSPEAE